jgi:hypothetical protein
MIPHTLVLEDHTASIFKAKASKVRIVAGSREADKGKVVPVLNEAHHHENIWGVEV